MFKRKPKKWTRFLIVATTSVFAIITIVITSIFGIGSFDNWNKSLEYGQSAVIIADIKSTGNDPITKDRANEIAQDVYTRIDPTESQSPPRIDVQKYKNKYDTKSQDNYRLFISVPNISNDDELDKIKNTVISQQILTFYTTKDVQVFNYGPEYNSSATSGSPSTTDNDGDQSGIIKPGSVHASAAKSSVSNRNWSINFTFSNFHTQSVFSDAAKGLNNESIAVWLGHDQLRAQAKKMDPSGFSTDGNNLYNYMQVTGPSGKSGVWKEKQYNVSNYLLGTMTLLAPTSDSYKLTMSTSVDSDGNTVSGLTSEEAKDFASRINFGLANYSLTVENSYLVPPSLGLSAFDKSLIVGGVIVGIVVVFLIVNYGVLGLISTIAMLLYLAISLMMFTIMRGDFSPEVIGAMILGIGIAADASIITFERLKEEVYQGYSPSKSLGKVNRLSAYTIFDSSLLTLIASFALFYVGTQSIKGISVMLIISITTSLIVMMIFSKLISSLLVNSGVFEKRKKLLGIWFEKRIPSDYQQAVKPKYQTLNYLKQTKWCSIGSAIVITVGIVVYAVFAGISTSFLGGFSRKGDFQKREQYIITDITKGPGFENNTIDEIENYFKSLGARQDDFTLLYTDSVQARVGSILVTSENDTFSGKLADYDKIQNDVGKISPTAVFEKQDIKNALAASLSRDAVYAMLLAFACMVIYILVRFRWTYAFALVVAMVHDGLIVCAVFIICRLPFDSAFIGGILIVYCFSVNDKIVVFDRIRERMRVRRLNEIYSYDMIKNVVNTSIGEIAKKSLLSMILMVTIVVCFIATTGSIPLSLGLVLLIGIIVSIYSSLFIATIIWTKIEYWRQLGIARRERKAFWKTKGIEEQTIESINEYSI